jgi:type IV pilus assembly protein PilP
MAGVRSEESRAVKNWMRTIAGLLAATLVGMTTGCSDEVEDLGKPGVAEFQSERQALASRRKPPAAPKKAPAATGAPAAVASRGSGYAEGDRDYFYDPRGKRDPFRSIRYLNAETEKKDFGPLGDFELGQLELSAVIWDAGNPRALVLDPGGRSYIVREGSAIGKNNGQVIHIGDNLVLVKETYENFAGEKTTKDVELRIRLSQGG